MSGDESGRALRVWRRRPSKSSRMLPDLTSVVELARALTRKLSLELRPFQTSMRMQWRTPPLARLWLWNEVAAKVAVPLRWTPIEELEVCLLSLHLPLLRARRPPVPPLPAVDAPLGLTSITGAACRMV